MAECTKCKHPRAVVGVMFVECPNPNCNFYSKKLRIEQIEEDAQLDLELEEEKTDPDKTPPFPFGAFPFCSD